MTAIAFYEDTALANRVPEALSPVYLSQTVWSRQSAGLAGS